MTGKRPFRTRKRKSIVPPEILAVYYARPHLKPGTRGFGRAKQLTKYQIERIRYLWDHRKVSQVELAVRYKTSQTTISRLVRGVPVSKAAVAVETARRAQGLPKGKAA